MIKLKNILFCLAVLSGTASFAQLPDAATIAAKMYPGWNLGNTLEGGDNKNNWTNNGGVGAERAWQSTLTSQKIIDFVKSQGFKSVRIPCAWVMGHVTDADQVTVDAAWMARVKEIVDYCVNDGLYVLLNDHWDGGWLENNFNDTSEAAITANSAKLKLLWTQIAEAFKDYDEHLLFGGLNEPNANNQVKTKALLRYEQAFIDAVRATGGNNATRTLVVQGPETSIENSCKWLDVSTLTDPAAGRLMVEVHYYTPPQFTGVWKADNDHWLYFWGAANHVPSGSYTKYNCTWGEESYLRDQFQMMKDNFVDRGYPVILGEYGANWRQLSNTSMQKKHDASILLFHKTVNEEAVKRGMIPFVWDINQPNRNGEEGIMCVIDRSACKVFDTNAMQGITNGCAAATWGGPTSDIRQVPFDAAVPSTAQPAYNLMGQRVASGAKGLVIIGGKKYYNNPSSAWSK